MNTQIYYIVKAPDAVLKDTAHAVDAVTPTLQSQIDRMFATMYDAPGIGLAANQVGLLNRVVVMDVPDGCWHYDGADKNGVLKIASGYKSGDNDEGAAPPEPVKNPLAMINPEIIYASDQRSVFEEGCLSLPGHHGIVERPAKVRVKYVDYNGNICETDAEGLFSHCVQHEIDHLNGTLFVDYLSSLKRNMIIRKMEKSKKMGLL